MAVNFKFGFFPRGRFRRALVAIGFFVIVVFLGVVLWSWNEVRRWNGLRVELEAEGWVFDLAESINVESDPNRAAVGAGFLADSIALGSLRDDLYGGEWLVEQDATSDPSSWASAEPFTGVLHDFPVDGATREDRARGFLVMLEKGSEFVAQLEGVMDRPAWSLDRSGQFLLDPANFDGWHFLELIEIQKFFYRRGTARLVTADIAGAMADFDRMMRVEAWSEQCPLLIGQLVAGVVKMHVDALIWEMLLLGELEENQLDVIAAAMDEQPSHHDRVLNVYRNELAYSVTYLDRMAMKGDYSDIQESRKMFGLGNARSTKAIEHLVHYDFYVARTKRITAQIVVAAIEEIERSQGFATASELEVRIRLAADAINDQPGEFPYLDALALEDYGFDSAAVVDHRAACRQLARAEIAVEMFHRGHGRFPEDMVELMALFGEGGEENLTLINVEFGSRNDMRPVVLPTTEAQSSGWVWLDSE